MNCKILLGQSQKIFSFSLQFTFTYVLLIVESFIQLRLQLQSAIGMKVFFVPYNTFFDKCCENPL